MSISDDEYMRHLEEEVRELILNSKSKKTTFLEPCTEENYLNYLKNLHDELALFGIRYSFNLHSDTSNEQITTEALVKLANAVWNLIQQHKEIIDNADKLKDRNYSLQQNNFFLNSLIDRQKLEIKKKEDEIKDRDQLLRLQSEKLEKAQKQLTSCKEEYKKLAKQKDSKEMQLGTEVKRLGRQYEVLESKFRGQCGVYTSRNDAKLPFAEEFRAREKKYKDTILKLQEANRKLIDEVLNLKDDLLCDCEDTRS